MMPGGLGKRLENAVILLLEMVPVTETPFAPAEFLKVRPHPAVRVIWEYKVLNEKLIN
jgi:hypothetical protein